MNKHTPGPWTAESVLSDGYLGLRVVAEDEDGEREVARVPIMLHASTPDFDDDGIEETPVRFPRQKSHTYTTELEADTIRANAALIAAAPDMLRALKVVCYAIAEYRDGGEVNLEELKYTIIDRIIEAVEPGFDGGVTRIEDVRAALAKAEGRA